MSYILDALRRADSDRGRGSVPDIHARQVPVVPTDGGAASMRMPAWAWAGAALLAVLLGAVVWLLVTRDAPREAVVVGAAGAVPSPVAAPTAAAPTAPPVAIVPAPTATLVVPAAGPASRPGATLNVRVQTQPARLPSIQADAPAQRKPAGKPEAASAALAKASAPEPRVYTVAELPDEVRRELPALTIGGAMYSQNPASRMLIINGQLFHERDKLAPGLVLVQIRLKSAVLEYKGYRYGIAF